MPILVVFVLSAPSICQFDVISVVVTSTAALRAAFTSVGSVHDCGVFEMKCASAVVSAMHPVAEELEVGNVYPSNMSRT